MAITDWPTLTKENRPWTRWWWLGSALSEGDITRSLGRFRDAGFGGVEISPIYGVKGFEDRFVPYLSPRWTALLAHTIREAGRLGTGVDMIVGTGWPYGGPWVTDADSPRKFVWETHPAGQPVPHRAGVELLAESAPDAAGNVLALGIVRTGQKVKRAAPGGDGNVLDHLSQKATGRYLAAFDDALGRLPEGVRLRSFFNDSYEVFGANTTPDILDEFARRRGYDLRAHLRDLHGGDGVDAETARRVRADYRETISDIVRDDFLGTWNGWAHRHQGKTRNQAHGSPGNLLDLYAAVDIPETEIFGPARLALGGMKALRPAPPDFGQEEEMLVCKMASSAAHVAGKPLCSSESFTWLGEHGCVPLAHARAEADTLFAMGINHIFCHGTPFSPEDVAWPGWLFYASTHVAPANTWWRDLGALNDYIARCQSLLQQGAHDGDVLLYFPFHDLLAGDAGAQDSLIFLAFHRTEQWLRGNLPEFVAATHALWRGGWGYDLVSDRQLVRDIANDPAHGLAATNGGARWRTLVVAGCRLMPPETLERIAALAGSGATVLVVGDLPADVPGLADLEARRARLHAAHAALLATGRVHVGADLKTLLADANVGRETLADHGLEFTRRRHTEDGELTYFIANPGVTDHAGWTTLGCPPGESVIIHDAMTGRVGKAAARRTPHGATEVYLDIPSGASRLLRVLPATTDPANVPAWEDYTPAGAPIPLTGEWTVAFSEGGPRLPASRTVTALSDWTTWKEDADALRAFSGTAHYALTFDAPTVGAHPASAAWALDLGEVCYSARVRLNNRDVGTLIARPWRLLLPGPLRPHGNLLEIEVTNLMANRIADLERHQGDAWRPFYLVDIRYKPFEAAASWEPLPSGLIGPVRLIPLAAALSL